jgi:hypothetical protein
MSINTSVHRVTSVKLGAIGMIEFTGGKCRDLEIETDGGLFTLTLFADDVAQLRVQLEEAFEV